MTRKAKPRCACFWATGRY